MEPNPGVRKPAGAIVPAFFNAASVAVAFCGLAGTVALFERLTLRERAELGRRTEVEAQHIAGQIQNGVMERLDPLHRIGEWWVSQGRPLSPDDWETDAQLFLTAGAGLQQLSWMEANGSLSWSVRPGALPDTTVQRPAHDLRGFVRRACSHNPAAISGVFKDENRKPAIYACSSVTRRGRLAGYIIGLYEIPRLIDSILEQQLPEDYQVSLAAGGQKIYSHHAGASARSLEGARRVEIRLPGAVWSAEVTLPASEIGGLRALTMGFGLLVTVLLYGASVIAHISRSRARELEQVNTALELEVGEHQRAEERVAELNRDLQRRLADFQTLLDVTPVGIAVADDPECRNIWMNPALAKMIGVSRDQNISKSGPDRDKLQYKLCRNGAEVPAEDLPMQRAARTGKDVIGDELEIVRADGCVRNTLSYSSPLFDENRQVRGVLNACVDVTEQTQAEKERKLLLEREQAARREAERMLAALKASEARFQRLIESDVIGVVIADSVQVIEANQYFLNVVGCTREDLTGGQVRWPEMTPAEYHAGDEVRINQLLATGKMGPFEKELIRKDDGRRVPVLIGGALVEPYADWRYIGFVLDLSQRRELEQRLQRAEKLKSLALMAGGVAHEFNNTLTAIIGNASLALEELSPKARPLISDAIAAASRAAERVALLIAYTGNAFHTLRLVDLSDVVAEMQPVIRAAVPPTVEMRFQLAQAMPLVRADAAEFQQVIGNLVTNAVEALAGKPGNIEIRTGACDLSPEAIALLFPDQAVAPGIHAWLEVSDTGCGMRPEAAARAFDPFFTTKFLGRGLGLSVVQGVVRAHGGAVRIETHVACGTRFEIILPGESRDLPARQEPNVLVAPGSDV
jgi:PAS domain S-box-containing protein